MKKIILFTLLCLLCGTAAVAQTLEISVKKYNTQDDDPVAVLTLDGALTAGNAALFNSKASEALKISRYVIVNMGKVELMDETGMTVLQNLRKNVGKVRGKTLLCCLQPMVKLVFEVTALDTVFQIFDTEGDALLRL